MSARRRVASGAAPARSTVAPVGEPATELDMPDRLVMFRRMVELRQFENKAYELFLLGLVKGTTHLARARRPSPSGSPRPCARTTTPSAPIAGTTTCCARGVSMARAMGELMGRAGGLLGGKGGSMHLADPSSGRMGSYAIRRRAPSHRLRRGVVGAGPRYRRR